LGYNTRPKKHNRHTGEEGLRKVKEFGKLEKNDDGGANDEKRPEKSQE